MATSKLDNPACKLEIKDIVHIKNEDETWVYSDAQLQFKITLLWLQGTIANISDDMNEICFQENGMSVVVNNCASIPGGNNWMQEGQYVMIFGEIQDAAPTTLCVRAIKISDLSHNTFHKQMWPLDVQEAKLIYAKLVNS